MIKIYKNLIRLSIILVILFINNIYASSIIYQEPQFNPDIIKPSPKIYEDENTVYYTDQNKSRSELEIDVIIQSNHPTMESFIDDTFKSEYTYIRHTSSITTVDGEYEWRIDNDDPTKWRLFIYHLDSYDLPFFARGGFYKIGDITYGFDKNGIMITGLAKDEYDIVYEFDDSGRLINKYQLKK